MTSTDERKAEERLLKGWWWLPGKEDDKVPGVLDTNPSSNWRLECFGCFENLDATLMSGEVERYPLVHGICGTGTPVTLADSVRSGLSCGTGPTMSSYAPRLVLVGHHFQPTDELRLKTLCLEYVCLPEWTGRLGWAGNVRFGDDGKRPEKWEASSAEQFEVVVPLTSFTVRFRIEPEARFAPRRSMQFQQKAYVQIDAETPKSMDEFMRGPGFHTTHLLTLAMGGSQIPTSAWGYTDSCRWGFPGDADSLRPVHLHWPDLRDAEVAAPSSLLDVVFRLADLRDEAVPRLQQYYAQAEKARPAYALFYATVLKQGMYIEQEFLFLVAALEVRDRISFGGQYADASEFAQVRQALENAVPSSTDARFREVIAGKLRYLNEFTLRDRLKRTVAATTNLLDSVVPDPAKFVRRTVEARNYLTHYDAPTAGTEGHKELLALIPQLRALVEVTIMLDMGITPDEVRDLMKHGNHFGNYAWRARHAAE